MNHILKKADDIIHGRREDEYGPAENSFAMVADFWNVFLQAELILTPHDVAMMMCLFKIAREAHAHKDDNLIDLCGYAALADKCVKESTLHDDENAIADKIARNDMDNVFWPNVTKKYEVGAE